MVMDVRKKISNEIWKIGYTYDIGNGYNITN